MYICLLLLQLSNYPVNFSTCKLCILFVLQACIQVCPKNPANFNVDNVRVAKLLGGGLHNSSVVRGMILKSDTVGSIKRIEKAKVQIIIYLHFHYAERVS